ncbi:MAG: leucine-rich repeat domain-containing protein [Verrucomicrobiota bacterium]
MTIRKGKNMKTQNSFATTTCLNTMASRLKTACAVRLLPLLLLLALPAAMLAQDYTYTTNADNTITITGYTGSGGAVTIPDTINGLPVTSIRNKAFWYNTNFTCVTVTNSVTIIGDHAFYCCSSLTNVIIGSAVTNIGGQVFASDTDLMAITVDPVNTSYNSLDGVLFNGTKTTLIQCPGGLTGSYTVPTSVTCIGSNAFDNCSSLTSVTLSDNVITIEDDAFSNCGMTNINLGNGVTSFGVEAFYQSGLMNVTIPASVTNISSSPFIFCYSLTAITVDPLNASYSSSDGVLMDKRQSTVIECPAGKPGTFAIPNSVTTIGAWAFSFLRNLVNITIGSGVTNIGDYAFAFSSSLSHVCFLGNAPSLGANVFNFGNNPTVYHPPGSTGWGATFGGLPVVLWDPLTQCTCVNNSYNALTISGYIGSSNKISIPSTISGLPVIFIESEAFSGNFSLTDVTISDGVKDIGWFAFQDCENLHSVQIPCSVTNIGRGAFEDCYGLTNVTIPDSVISMAEYAFDYCTSLKGVYFQGNAPRLTYSGGVFFGDIDAIIYYLPGTAGWIPQMQSSDASFGVQTNRFGFNITGASSLGVVVEACTNLANPTWSPVKTNILTSGLSYFSDPSWTNYPTRFYRAWGATFNSRPTKLWNPQAQTGDSGFGVRMNRFGFNITGTTNIPIVVDACTNLANSTWVPLQSCTLTNGSVYFSDPDWTNYPARFYRIRSP